MFKMVAVDGRDGPVPFCDYCGEEITKATNGNYEWERNPAALDEPATIYLSHKHCTRQLEQAKYSGTGLWSNMELQVFPIYLGNRMQLNWAHARELAGDMASI
jgi:hypothetical protein